SVRVTVSGTRITDVSMANLQTAESYSQQIANQVIPYLRHQVLALQSSQINGISGATYTSEAYSMSVQSALDKLHVP
ncbi:MAG: FMN-binding protein, partial [Acidimicrobiales bacterium]